MNEKIKFIIIGGINTVAGYLITILVYNILIKYNNIFLIGIVSNALSITLSYINNRLFVFNVVDGWWSGYIKSFFSYALIALFGTLLLWISIRIIGIDVWIAQFYIIIINSFISFYIHKLIIFKINK
jgi:putative flippase GtrA